MLESWSVASAVEGLEVEPDVEGRVALLELVLPHEAGTRTRELKAAPEMLLLLILLRLPPMLLINYSVMMALVVVAWS
jgi:hypothetical protein